MPTFNYTITTLTGYKQVRKGSERGPALTVSNQMIRWSKLGLR